MLSRAALFVARYTCLLLSLLLSGLSARAQTVTLATPYHPQLDVQAYWVSEKYDGVRAHWDGQQLRRRLLQNKR